jgi:hypothetical protein
LVILYVKSRFFYIVRGVQVDNGVDPPWTHILLKQSREPSFQLC